MATACDSITVATELNYNSITLARNCYIDWTHCSTDELAIIDRLDLNKKASHN